MPIIKPPEGEPLWIIFRWFFDGDFSLGGAVSDFCMLLRREDVYAMIVALHSFHCHGWLGLKSDCCKHD